MFKKLIFVIKTGYTNFRQGIIVKDKGVTQLVFNKALNSLSFSTRFILVFNS